VKTLLALAATSSLVFAQGPLTPPAAPAPTMKTLAQIEPRTPIPASTSISTPGSYYLTDNVAGGITITANDVTLDLNGFAVQPGLNDGITISSSNPRTNVTIRNGSVVGSGVMTFTNPTGAVQGTFSGNTSRGIIAYGRTAGNTSGQNIRIENVTIRGFNLGIILASFEETDGGRHTLTNCIVRDFGSYGISASQSVMRGCVVQAGAGTGITGNAIVAENVLVDRVVGVGISGNNHNLTHVNVRSTSGNGIDTSFSKISNAQLSSCAIGINGGDNQIEGISINACTGSGIFSPNSSISGVTASFNAGAGVWADSSTISNCTIRSSGADGIRGVNSTISMCKSSGNDTNTADGYAAAGIVWAGGRQVNNVTDLYSPAAPAP
jgi:hypothetical protein